MVFHDRIDHGPSRLDSVLAGEERVVARHGVTQQPVVRCVLGQLPLHQAELLLVSDELLPRPLDAHCERDGRARRHAEAQVVRLPGRPGRVAEQRLRRWLHLNKDLGGGSTKALACADVPRDTLPPPGVDEQTQSAKRLDIRCGVHPRLPPVFAVLTAHQVTSREGSHRPENLHLLVAE